MSLYRIIFKEPVGKVATSGYEEWFSSVKEAKRHAEKKGKGAKYTISRWVPDSWAGAENQGYWEYLDRKDFKP